MKIRTAFLFATFVMFFLGMQYRIIKFFRFCFIRLHIFFRSLFP